MNIDNIYVIIPAYNPPLDILQRLIAETKTVIPKTSIIVINDSSKKQYNVILNAPDVYLIQHEKNLGKGAALKSGFRMALEKGADFVLTMDADGQHAPGEAIKLIRKMVEDKLDLVIGSRMKDLKSMPWHRVLSNKMTSRLISWRLSDKIEDSQSGYRLIGRRLLKNLKLKTNKFDLESELLIKAGLQGYRIGFVDIATIYGDERSAMGATDMTRFAKLFITSLFWNRSADPFK